jgi:tRNA (guanine-N7-)-methyltransferase
MPKQVVIQSDFRLDPETCLENLDWPGVFGNPAPVEIEIGIGKGRFLLAAAELRPDINHLGIEWANKYLRIAETRATRRELENVRFVRVDARELVHRAIPDHSVRTYYIFYPDPWPKKRHHKRRFFRADTVGELSRTLIGGGLLHAATDHRDYWEEAIYPLMDAHPDFEALPEFGGPEFPLPTDGPLTNFEAKYRIEGRGRYRGSWRRRPAR